MASQSEKSQKWKRMMRAEKMRAVKKTWLKEAGHGDCDTQNQGMGGDGPSAPRTSEEFPLAVPSTSSAVDEPEDESSGHDHAGDHSSFADR